RGVRAGAAGREGALREVMTSTGGNGLGDARTALGTGPGVPSSDAGLDDAWRGRVVDGRYRVEGLLGEGGMGAVYVAEHLTLHKQVALKVIRGALLDHPEVAARFAREAMTSARLDHRHVASAVDYGELPEGGSYLVMQLARGRSLRDMLDTDGAAPFQVVCELGAQIADALCVAHESGIVHRDLKPENLMIERRSDGGFHVRV